MSRTSAVLPQPLSYICPAVLKRAARKQALPVPQMLQGALCNGYLCTTIILIHEAFSFHDRSARITSFCLQLRAYRLWKVQQVLQRYTNISSFWIIIFRNIALVVTVTHLFACMFFFIAHFNYYVNFQGVEGEIDDDSYEEASWFGVHPEKMREWSAVEKYVRSMYWSMTTFTTVGYGDISPVTTPEQAYVVVCPRNRSSI